MSEKLCPKCKTVKAFSEFYKNNATQNGLRSHCKKCCSEYRKARYYANPQRYINYTAEWGKQNIARRNAYMVKYHLRLKMLIIKHYGERCNCCGEKEVDFLTIDHINGGGGKHRKIVGGGGAVYREIIKKNYPSSYRLLCMNCNWATRKGKICPHQRQAKAALAKAKKLNKENVK